MSTVGRMACTFALMKVLTRSRGTPAAAFPMYFSRKVLVDTELLHCTRQKAEGQGQNACLQPSTFCLDAVWPFIAGTPAAYSVRRRRSYRSRPAGLRRWGRHGRRAFRGRRNEGRDDTDG